MHIFLMKRFEETEDGASCQPLVMNTVCFFSDCTEAAEECCIHTSRRRAMVCVWTPHLAGAFVRKVGLHVNASFNPEISRETKAKSPHHSWERELRIKIMTELSAAGKKGKKNKLKQKTHAKNIPRNIWVLCRNQNLYNPSTIIYN